MDRLVKCPGSLKVAKGSLEAYDKYRASKQFQYAQNRIENNDATMFGQIVDELAKSYISFKTDAREPKRKFVKTEHEIDPNYYTPAVAYANHIDYVNKRLGPQCNLDPYYCMDNYIQDLPEVEFRVAFNPDVVVGNYYYSDTVYVSDLSTGKSYARNKMFQVVCCALGVIEHNPATIHCICEVYNTTTRQIMLSKFSRDELEAYRDDIIIPTLQNVREALSCDKNDINHYRSHCSWCDSFCILKDECNHACKSVEEEYADNDVPTDLYISLDEHYRMTQEDAEKYANLFD